MSQRSMFGHFRPQRKALQRLEFSFGSGIGIGDTSRRHPSHTTQQTGPYLDKRSAGIVLTLSIQAPPASRDDL